MSTEAARRRFVEAVRHQQAGRSAEAEAALHETLHLDPSRADAHLLLGDILRGRGRIDDATASYQRAVELRPEDSAAMLRLAGSLREIGRLEEAIDLCRRATAVAPDPVAASALLHLLHFRIDDPQALKREHVAWDRRFAARYSERRATHPNDPDPNRRLRIGYVSPDFNGHSQSLFTTPLLAFHDPERVEVFCYSDVLRPDRLTDELRRCADRWRDTAALDDAALAERVRADRIDILFDLTLHMERNRLLMFARRPAPVQASWLGYPGTTGLSGMDFRLSDPLLDPGPETESHSTERTIRLARTFWCYDPLSFLPPAVESPMARAGHAAFGCLNHFSKVTDAALDLWARVLRTVPNSRMVISVPPGSARRRVLARFGSSGVEPSRIEFVDRMPRDAYLNLYRRIDLSLDTFPYPGHTTGMDSLWMGVPIVTLPGRTAVSRGGAAILRQVGLSSLIAADPEDYVRIAIRAVGDPTAAAALRASLRLRMERSPLMDAPRFARDFEAACREMWGDWCARRLGRQT